MSAPATTAPTKLAREHVILIGVLLVASFVVILNETVMSVAIPVLQEDLGVEPSVGQWLTTAFLLTMGVIIPLTGFLIERIPTRQLFVLAMSLFTAGTILAFLAPGFGVLLTARVIQASGTAIMMPLLMTTILTIVPPERRGVMMGNITIVISVAPALGPTVSGLILDHFGWRWIFGLVAPIAVLALVLGVKYVVEVGERSNNRVDLLSVPLAVVGFGGVVYGLSSIGKSAGGSGVPLWVPFVAGGLALVTFLIRQIALQREDRALLDLRVFGARQFTLAMIALAVGFGMLMGTLILVPYFAQQVLGFGAAETGLVTLPGGILMGLAGPVVGRLYDAYGPRPITLPGTLLVSAGIWMLAMVDTDTPAWWLVLSNIGISVGLAATFTPVMTSGLGSVPARLYSHGSATLGTFQQVAGAAGTAVLVSLMTVVARRSSGGVSDPEGIVDGVRAAFMVAGILSFVLIAVCLFVRRPAHEQV
ncbi:DHA2 family efflux MFS transporter permease subunit [Aeromicrobium phragmitis]|uniref:DHA2 family efflux MFS transporter permease subunit n=1 Tax=Aeromicrobium phragmitis TaxID=2478914 RepID=A0A3L8PM51_9ACTN|nr:MDR family MFS transporter [Aeromicrobium phragmitis]RLV56340.1 DHA2 family efflux MFS transporter permease subunit [Aeromicrobium phragmitis]